MNALILAAGLGTRLRPLTNSIPKAIVPLAGKPLIEHQICRLRDAGIKHIAVNVHHHADLLTDYLRSHDFGVDILISDETTQLLDTGGAIKQAARLLPPHQLLLVHNVDIFHHIPLKDFIASHQPTDDATLLTTDRTSSRLLLADSQQRLKAWTNTNTGEVKPAGSSTAELSPQAFSGIHILSPQLIQLMDDWPNAFSVIDFYLACCQSHTLRLQLHPNTPLIDVGKLDSLAQAETLMTHSLHSHLHADCRGLLHVVGPADLPFTPKRIFWISHVPEGQTRGGHLHQTCAEALFAQQGSVQITLCPPKGTPHTITLDKPSQGLLIPPGTWCKLHHFSPDALLLALANEEYQPDGYIHSDSPNV